MITLRRMKERYHDRRHRQEVWCTFHPQARADPLADGFGPRHLDEDRLAPGGHLPPHPPRDADIVTYVRERGARLRRLGGPSGVIQAGEFRHDGAHRVAVRREEPRGRRRARVSALAPPRARRARVRPRAEALQRGGARGTLCVVASPERAEDRCAPPGRADVFGDARLRAGTWSTSFGQSRSAWGSTWCEGEVTLGDIVLTTGDGVGVTAGRAVSLTARVQTEIVLLDLGDRA